MQVSSRISNAHTGDSLAYLANRAVGTVTEEATETGSSAQLSGGTYDPSARVSLSVEALLVLSGTSETDQARYPALTTDERNNIDTPELAAREYEAFGKYAETGDFKNYYRAYIEYYDNLQPIDQQSLRYDGSREKAVSALRSFTYNEEVSDTYERQAGAQFDRTFDTGTSASGYGDAASVTSPVAITAQYGVESSVRMSARISRATSMYYTSF
ncbi:hypothetical protein [Sinorhizobium sp. BG8]|uniref:hypothetical protein n=1 Tax=Sinorhizobium sp. BG8 TaxID=2613773 RepID=UPI00193D5CCA|nr:hypothetical protein [Sinorhizobium sp. BG8]QRM55372.1 biotin biosynthesis protein BioC [Sinorhizobium sp. BG8]